MSGDGVVAYPLFQEGDGGANPTSPLQLKLSIIDTYKACELNKLWHSRLPIIFPKNISKNRRSICFGAHFNNIWYAVAIWTTPVAANFFKNGYELLELRRLAISADAPKNTASRLISLMSKYIKQTMPEINRLISYQDPEVHKGIIYKASGWKIGFYCNTSNWNNRIRNKPQTNLPKIRWEKDL